MAGLGLLLGYGTVQDDDIQGSTRGRSPEKKVFNGLHAADNTLRLLRIGLWGGQASIQASE